MLIASPELAVRSGQDEAPVIRLPRPAPGPILPWPWRDSGYPPRRTRGHPPRRHHDTTRQLERTPWPRLGTPARPSERRWCWPRSSLSAGPAQGHVPAAVRGVAVRVMSVQVRSW